MRSLFARLFTTQLIVVLVALIALGTSLSYMYTQYIFELKERELISIGEQLASVFGGAPFSPLSLGRIQNLVQAAHVYGDAQVLVIDAGGNIVLSSTLDPRIEGLKFSQEDVRAIFSGGIVRRRTFLRQLDEPAFAVAVPITAARSVIGAVILHAPLTGIMQTINGGRQLIIWASVLAASLAAAVSFLFTRRVTGPLQQMRVVALDMASGNFKQRVTVPGTDEVAELATALNELAERLDDTIRALGVEKRKTESVIAGLAEGVLAVDTAGRVLLANSASRELLGTNIPAPGEVLSAGPEILTKLHDAFAQVMRDNAPQSFHVDTSGKTLSINISPVADPEGEALGAVALVQDVSERQRLEKMRRDFVADVSHELRTPLTSIYGFAQAMAEGVATTQEQVKRYLKVIMDESLRLVRLTNTLLDLSRIEAHNVVLHPTPVHLAEVISDAISSLEPLLTEKKVAASFGLAPGTPWVLADVDRLEQIVLNLLDNAIRHAPENGRVTVEAEPTGDGMVRVVVSDNGPGIPEAELPFIWERFYKVDKARRQNRSGGTGLGLVIVRQLVELHGGKVSAGNNAGGGARFTFTLPQANDAPVAADTYLPEEDHAS